ncbi:MAG TPA: hypothetical protein VIL65_01845 [Beijerinckiaceae bacterium]|jgi:hypothetical protein
MTKLAYNVGSTVCRGVDLPGCLSTDGTIQLGLMFTITLCATLACYLILRRSVA